LVGSEKVSRFRGIHESDCVKEFDPIGLMAKIPASTIIHVSASTFRMLCNALRFKLANRSPTVRYLRVVDASGRLGKYTKLSCERFYKLGDAFFSLFGFLRSASGNRGLDISR